MQPELLLFGWLDQVVPQKPQFFLSGSLDSSGRVQESFKNRFGKPKATRDPVLVFEIQTEPYGVPGQSKKNRLGWRQDNLRTFLGE